MKDAFRKFYYLGHDDKTYVDADTPTSLTYEGDTGSLDGSSYESNFISIQLSSTSAMTYEISNPKPGTTYVIEATGTGTNDRVITLTDCSYNDAGDDTITLSTQNAIIALLCIAPTRYVTLSSMGSVEISGTESTPVTKVVKSVRHPLVFDTAGSFDIGLPVPAGSRVLSTVITVTEIFDGASESTLTIGDASVADRFCATTEVDLAIAEKYYIVNYHNYSSETQITGTYVQDSASQGAAYIEVFYSIT